MEVSRSRVHRVNPKPRGGLEHWASKFGIGREKIINSFLKVKVSGPIENEGLSESFENRSRLNKGSLMEIRDDEVCYRKVCFFGFYHKPFSAD